MYVLNLYWFAKVVNGVRRTLAKLKASEGEGARRVEGKGGGHAD